MNSDLAIKESVDSSPLGARPQGKWYHWYRVVAFAVFNSLLLIILLNVVLYLISLRMQPSTENSPIVRYGEDKILKAYPGWRQEDVKTLLKETYGDLGVEYESFTEFKNKTLHQKYVNVDPAGFRLSDEIHAGEIAFVFWVAIGMLLFAMRKRL